MFEQVWSAYKLPSNRCRSPEVDGEQDRHVYTHDEYINLVLQDGHVMAHDYSHRSTEEDPRMMAFFDSLVQREFDGWSSDDSMTSNEEALYSRILQLSQSDIDSDDSIPGLGPMGENVDPNYSPFTIAFASVMSSQAAEGNDMIPRLNRLLDSVDRGTPSAVTVDNNEARTQSSPDVSHWRMEQSLGSDVDSDKPNVLSELVKKKKSDMQESLKKRMKDLKTTQGKTSVNDCSSSESSDTGSMSSLNIELINSDETAVHERKVTNVINRNELPNETQKKLKRLNNLRKRVLNDSESSEDEKVGKCVKDSKIVRSLSIDSGADEKVQFKKLKRKRRKGYHVESADTSKSRASPDLGPFIKKSGTNIDNRRSSNEDKAGKRNPSDKSRHGKHRVTKTETVSSNLSKKHIKHDQDHNHEKESRNKSDRNHDKDHTRRHSESSDRHRHKHHTHSNHKSTHRTRHRSHSGQSREEERCSYYRVEHSSANVGVNCQNLESQKQDSGDSQLPITDSFSNNSVNKRFVKDQKYEDLSDWETDICKNCDKGDTNLDNKNLDKHRKKHDRDIDRYAKKAASDSKCDSSKYASRKSCDALPHLKDSSDSEEGPSCSYSKSKSNHINQKGEHSSKVRDGPEEVRDGPEEVRDGPEEVRDGPEEVRDGPEDSESSGEEGQQTWREFRRFKNRLERARRRYGDDKHKNKRKDQHSHN